MTLSRKLSSACSVSVMISSSSCSICIGVFVSGDSSAKRQNNSPHGGVQVFPQFSGKSREEDVGVLSVEDGSGPSKVRNMTCARDDDNF